jgi:hypothetical protein
MPLTDLAVRNSKPKERPYKLTDGKGMFLHVLPNGSRYWRLKFYFEGKEKLMSLGVYGLKLIGIKQNGVFLPNA